MSSTIMAITCGRMGSRMANVKRGRRTLSFPIYSVKLYALRERADGVKTWRFVRHLSDGHTVFSTVERQAEQEALLKGLSFVPNLIHGARAS